MAVELLTLLLERFGGEIVTETHSKLGDDTAMIALGAWLDVAKFVRDGPRFQLSMLVDLCAVDYPDREPRFEVVVHLLSMQLGHRLRLKTRTGQRDGSGAQVQSLSALWPAANWLERETFDLMGVQFLGHPDLRRILLYEEFQGHPLRKDYPAARTQPLVRYREDAGVGRKLPPFSDAEGMSLSRRELAEPELEDV